MARNPNDTSETKEYVFEVHGEVIVRGYSEEDAKYWLDEELEEVLADAVRNGTLEIKE